MRSIFFFLMIFLPFTFFAQDEQIKKENELYKSHLKLAKEMSINLMVHLYLDKSQTDDVRETLLKYQTEVLETQKKMAIENSDAVNNENDDYMDAINRVDRWANMKIDLLLSASQKNKWNRINEGWWKLFKSKAFEIKPKQEIAEENK